MVVPMCERGSRVTLSDLRMRISWLLIKGDMLELTRIQESACKTSLCDQEHVMDKALCADVHLCIGSILTIYGHAWCLPPSMHICNLSINSYLKKDSVCQSLFVWMFQEGKKIVL